MYHLYIVLLYNLWILLIYIGLGFLIYVYIFYVYRTCMCMVFYPWNKQLYTIDEYTEYIVYTCRL